VRRPLAPTPAKVTELVLPVLGRLAEAEANSSVREAARVALASVQEAEWSELPATALREIGWTVDAATLERIGLALEQPRAAPEALAPLTEVAALRFDDPLRAELASRLTRRSEESQRERIGLLFVIGAVATPAASSTAALHSALFDALDDEADTACVARLALARCATRTSVALSRAPAHLELERAARTELHRRFDDSDPSRRRATWLAAAWLERGRAQVREEADVELVAELRKRFRRAETTPDAAASALSLALVDDHECLPALREHFAAASAPHAYLALALALFDDRTSIEPIEAWSHAAQNESHRIDGSLAIALLGDKSAPVFWIELLTDRNLTPTVELARQLAAIGDTRAVDPLIASICRTDLGADVRVELIRALADICGPNSPRRTVAYWFSGR